MTDTTAATETNAKKARTDAEQRWTVRAVARAEARTAGDVVKRGAERGEAGAYTCVRRGEPPAHATCFGAHVERLVETCRLVAGVELDEEARRVIQSVLRDTPEAREPHSMHVVVVYPLSKTLEHASFPLPMPMPLSTPTPTSTPDVKTTKDPSANVSVAWIQRGSGARQTPRAKDAKWPITRAPLEKIKTERGADELVLEQDGDVLEGLVTNVFVVRRSTGVVETAPDDVVLNGTMRGVAIDVCRSKGLPLVLRAPRVDEASDWACFLLTSCTKPVVGVRRVRFSRSGSGSLQDEVAEFVMDDVDANAVAAKLRRGVCEALADMSSSLGA